MKQRTHYVPNVKITDVELSVRAEHALAIAGITDLGQLSRMTYGDICRMRNCGIATIRELLALCLRHCVVPAWLREIDGHGPHQSASTVWSGDAPPPDMELLAGPYLHTERWMMEAALAQLAIAGIPYRLTLQPRGGPDDPPPGWYIYRARDGMLPVPPEEQE